MIEAQGRTLMGWSFSNQAYGVSKDDVCDHVRSLCACNVHAMLVLWSSRLI